jgi:hypothetical protein
MSAPTGRTRCASATTDSTTRGERTPGAVVVQQLSLHAGINACFDSCLLGSMSEEGKRADPAAVDTYFAPYFAHAGRAKYAKYAKYERRTGGRQRRRCTATCACWRPKRSDPTAPSRPSAPILHSFLPQIFVWNMWSMGASARRRRPLAGSRGPERLGSGTRSPRGAGSDRGPRRAAVPDRVRRGREPFRRRARRPGPGEDPCRSPVGRAYAAAAFPSGEYPRTECSVRGTTRRPSVPPRTGVPSARPSVTPALGALVVT